MVDSDLGGAGGVACLLDDEDQERAPPRRIFVALVGSFVRVQEEAER